MAALQTRMTLTVDDVEAKLRALDKRLEEIEAATKLTATLDISDAELQAQAFTAAFDGLGEASVAIDGIEQAMFRASPSAKAVATNMDKANLALKGFVSNNPALRGITGAFNQLGSQMATIPGPIGSIGTALSNVTPVMIAATAAAVGFGVALVSLAKNAFDFQQATNILITATNASGDLLEDLQRSTNNLFTTVPVSLDNAASAVARVNQLVDLTGDSLDLLSTQFAQLSILEGSNLEQSVRPLIGTFRNLGVESEDYSDKLDVLFATSQAYGTTTERLAVTLGAAGSALRVLGLNFDEAAELAAKFNAANLESSEVINSLATAQVNIAELNVALRELGDQRENVAAVREVLSSFNVPGEQASKLASSVASGALTFENLGQVGAVAGDRIGEVFDRTDTIARQFQVTLNQLRVDLEPIGAGILSIASAVLEELSPAFEALGSFIQAIDGPVIAFFELVGTVIAAPLKLLGDFFGLLGDIKDFFTGGLFGDGLGVNDILGAANDRLSGGSTSAIERIEEEGRIRREAAQLNGEDIDRTSEEFIAAIDAVKEREAESIVNLLATVETLRKEALDELTNSPTFQGKSGQDKLEAIAEINLKFDLAVDELNAQQEVDNAADAIKARFDGVFINEVPVGIGVEIVDVDFGFNEDLFASELEFESFLINERAPAIARGFAEALNDEEAKARAAEGAADLAAAYADTLNERFDQIDNQLQISFNIDPDNGINDVQDAINQAQAVIDSFNARQEAADRLTLLGFDSVAAEVLKGDLDELANDVLEAEGGTNQTLLAEFEATLEEAKRIGIEAKQEEADASLLALSEAYANSEIDPYSEYLENYQVDADSLQAAAEAIVADITESVSAGESLEAFLEAGKTSGKETAEGVVIGLTLVDLGPAGIRLAKELEASIRAALDSNSPSKKGMAIGADVTKGIELGLLEDESLLQAAERLGGDLGDAIEESLANLNLRVNGELDNPYSRSLASIQEQARSIREQIAEEKKTLADRERAIERLQQFGGFSLFEAGVDAGDFDDILKEIIDIPAEFVFQSFEDALRDLDGLVNTNETVEIEGDLKLTPSINGATNEAIANEMSTLIGPVPIVFVPKFEGGVSLFRDGGVALKPGAKMISFGGVPSIYNESYRGEEVHVGGPKGEAIVGDYHSYGLSFNRLDRIGLLQKLAPMVNAKYPTPGSGTFVVQSDNTEVVAGLATLDQRLSKMEAHARSTARSNDMMADDTARQMAIMRRTARRERSTRGRR